MRIMGLDVGDKIIGIAISDFYADDSPGKEITSELQFRRRRPANTRFGGGIRSSPDRHGNPMHMNGKASRQGIRS